MIAWIERWRDWIAPEAEKNHPGVWRRRDGGFHVRGRATDPRTGRLREVNLALPDCRRANEAARRLREELDAIKHGARGELVARHPRFGEYAVDLLERKIATGQIASAATKEKWITALEAHLVPRFGDLYLDKITKLDIEQWKVSLGTATHNNGRRKYSPTTCNSLLAMLKTILAAAAADFDGLADPSTKVEPFSTKTHRTYTDEQPNAFRIEDIEPFLDAMRMRWPEHYAMVYLGMWTGWRPSMLRPLRRRGPLADVNWQTGELVARRSHTVGSVTMTGTKNGFDQKVKLPAQVLSVLEWHVQRLDRENERRRRRSPELAAAMDASELLFPSEPNGRTVGGGFRDKSSLRRAFKDVSTAINLPYTVTPRALRRTFQDLARGGGVSDVVTRAVCGHRTPAMTAHYSTVDLAEREAAMAKVIDFAAAVRRQRESEAASGSTPPPHHLDDSESHRPAPADDAQRGEILGKMQG